MLVVETYLIDPSEQGAQKNLDVLKRIVKST